MSQLQEPLRQNELDEITGIVLAGPIPMPNVARSKKWERRSDARPAELVLAEHAETILRGLAAPEPDRPRGRKQR